MLLSLCAHTPHIWAVGNILGTDRLISDISRLHDVCYCTGGVLGMLIIVLEIRRQKGGKKRRLVNLHLTKKVVLKNIFSIRLSNEERFDASPLKHRTSGKLKVKCKRKGR